MKMYYLSKHVMFREKDHYILVCDCRSFQNYSFPIKYMNDLNQLRTGVLIDEGENFYKDLLILNMISENWDIAYNL